MRTEKRVKAATKPGGRPARLKMMDMNGRETIRASDKEPQHAKCTLEYCWGDDEYGGIESCVMTTCRQDHNSGPFCSFCRYTLGEDGSHACWLCGGFICIGCANANSIEDGDDAVCDRCKESGSDETIDY